MCDFVIIGLNQSLYHFGIIFLFVNDCVTEHEFLLELLQELCTSLHVNEQRVNFSNICDINLS